MSGKLGHEAEQHGSNNTASAGSSNEALGGTAEMGGLPGQQSAGKHCVVHSTASVLSSGAAIAVAVEVLSCALQVVGVLIDTAASLCVPLAD